MHFEHVRFDNGLEVIGEPNPDARSVALGFFVRTGSRDETEGINGVTHFLEHMIFKGTERRSAMDVNRELDEMGAKSNAATSEENTVFWGAVLPEYLPRLVDLLADILRPSLRTDDFDVEKQVILEEIGMYDDQPGWKVYERAMCEHFAAHPLGKSVLGTRQTIDALRREQMQEYFDRRYRADNIVVAATGKFEWPRLCELVAERCSAWPSGASARATSTAPGSQRFCVLRDEKVNQAHVILMSAAPTAESRDRFAAGAIAAVIGDATGSRLFWELVDPGHAESADMDYHEYQGAGAYLTYLSCEPAAAPANLARIRAVFQDVMRNGVGEQELNQVKNKAAARIVLASERPMGRLTPLGFNWVYRHEYRSIDDDLKSVQSITQADVRRVLDQFPLDRLTQMVLGPLTEQDFAVGRDA